VNAEPGLEADIIEHIQREFSADTFQEVLSKLQATSSSPRIQRCIAFASHGDRQRFDLLCEFAGTDYRDVIVAAEYDPFMTRLYDFDQPIPKARLNRV
jgi:hypothetical protein